jgi:DNA processing protein
MSERSELPDVAWLAALASLPGMGPVRLAMVTAGRTAREAWAGLATRAWPAVPEVAVQQWRAGVAVTDVAALWQAHGDAGVRVLGPGDHGWPSVLSEDLEPPAVLFARGDPAVLERPRVAIVGTRRCSYAGREVARSLGQDLSDAGVCVVSGLALGIDGAAHAGALAGATAPAGVVATGLDVVYPRGHTDLWRAGGEQGVLLSEYPLGVWPERWRFPARNRIIAALADVVVVVESHDRGGSMHTVESALERDRLVMAVPGSVRSPASAGTNALLAAGSPPARDAADVLVALGLDRGAWERAPAMVAPDGDAAIVLDALGWEPSSLEQIADRLDAPLGPVAVHLASLIAEGWVAHRAGWYERVR